jgi:alanyl-tRNA synthetase
MKSIEIRDRFFKFFTERGHTKVPSSSLIPAQDPTLLFTNAGMNQFKDVFLGKEKRRYDRAVSIQKCVRAGGKHNDLDNVGFTKRHLTFFEMMGNFSFGDYFKKDAIAWAWEFMTQHMKLPIEKLHASIFQDDDESYDIWHKTIGLPKERIHRLGKKDNFWQMGDIGPCGPCSEIFIDRGPSFGCKHECGPACGCDRFLEVWNLVFMEFDQQTDGELKPLKQKGVDTGMGLERLCTIMQDRDSVFETDLFMPIIKETEKLTGLNYEKQSDEIKAAFRVLADHIRAATMIISDGGAPSNEGRGYVLRKIIRRAALFAQKLINTNIFPQLALVVIDTFGTIYPELKENNELIIQILTSEIEKFSVNLLRGQQILNEYLKEGMKTKRITGEQAFKLYDTFGFPIELVLARAREIGYTVDEKGFEKEMEKQQAQSGKKTTDTLDHIDFDNSIKTEFTGYQELKTPSEIIALISDTTLVDSIPKGTTCWVLTKKSPFFIVGGGQVPDQGWLLMNGQRIPIMRARYINGRIATQISAPVGLHVGMQVMSIVDPEWRTNAMKNHTATHLLQAALISLFGKHIKQSGSLVHPDYLRFDFSYHQNLGPEDIKRVEDLVNAKIRENILVNIEQASFKEAIDRGVLAFFGEKYNPEQVRIVNIPGFSMELCGGTHVPRTGDIGSFKITDVSSISAGHRRIIALTGPKAINLFQETFNTTKKLSNQFNIQRDQLIEQVEKQTAELKDTQKRIKQLKQQMILANLPRWKEETTKVNGIPFLFLSFDDMANDELRDIAQLLQKQHPGFYFLVSEIDDRSAFVVSNAAQLSDRLNLKNFGSWLKEEHGLHGGGPKNILQGGGAKIDGKLKENIIEWLKKQK